MLFDADSGQPLALLDGNWITAMRTGAVAAHSVTHFARGGYGTVGMVGLGNVARATMLVLASVAGRELDVKLLRYKDQAELFEERFAGFGNLRFSVVDTVEEVVRGTDVVISCATYLERDVAEDGWFERGVLVVPVHTRGFTNCDLFFDKVFADDTAHVEHFGNFREFRRFAEVSDVMAGIAAGRESDEERILAYNIGVSTHDVNYAARIYQMVSERPGALGSLAEADLGDPTEKFWV